MLSLYLRMYYINELVKNGFYAGLIVITFSLLWFYLRKSQF